MYILASASPRRKELLSLITTDFKIVPSGEEETVPNNIPPEKQPEYLARLKALSVSRNYPEYTVIGADTSVIADGKILGKPKNRSEARDMITALSGSTHKVITGCAIVKNGICRSFSKETLVEFYALDECEIEEYISTDEPYDKAGAYGIQGRGALLVKGIKGDYFNVVGLPVAALKRELGV